MSRDYWMTRRKAPIISKQKQTITLQAININPSFINRASVYSNGGADSDIQNTADTFPTYLDNFTVELWAKVQVKIGQTEIYLLQVYGIEPNPGGGSVGNGLDFFIQPTSNAAMLTVFGATASPPKAEFPLNTWVHVAFSYSYTTYNKLKLYINGVLKSTATPTVQFTYPIKSFSINHPTPELSFVGNVAEFRIWNLVRTDDEILAAYNKPQGRWTSGGKGSNQLRYYLRLNEGVGNIAYPSGGNVSGVLGVNCSWSTTDYPPLVYGSSFVVAKWPVTLPKNVSLQWPITMPENTTGMLCVTWTDSNGLFQRRKLWALDGVDIAPQPELYKGENLSNTFVVELWNIDGASSCALTQNVVLGISSCTNPATSYDKTQQAAIANPTPDTTLAQNLPLTPFPLQFNTQQVYPNTY